MLTILSPVAGGVGVALLPANAQNIGRKGVIYRAIQEQTPTLEIVAVWRRDHSSTVLQNFLEVIQTIAT
jgi:DNA-binding transcriptional LysR family regulator